MFLSYQYRVYPLRSQLPVLSKALDELTYLWNYALAERRDAWEKEKRSVTYLDQQARLKAWRARDVTGLGTVSYEIAKDCLQRLDLAVRAFFRRVKVGEKPGYPRFRRRMASFTFVPDRDPWRDGPNGTCRLMLSRVGPVPVRRHRAPPSGTAKSVTICRGEEAWYATLQYEIPDPIPPTALPDRPVGVDLGLTHLATLSNGETIEAPRFLRNAERRFRRAQRRLSRKQRGSHRYARQRERLARSHARVRRQRRWLAHQLSHDWAERFDLVAFENLEVGMMSRSPGLSKSIHDAGWGMLREMTGYKALLRSRRCVRVDASGTTQTCAKCGRNADPPLTLSDRVYRCPCGHEADRDVNAARNILARGLDEVRRNTAELKRVDGTPPPSRKGRRAYQRKREPTEGRPGPTRAQQLARAPGRPATRAVTNLCHRRSGRMGTGNPQATPSGRTRIVWATIRTPAARARSHVRANSGSRSSLGAKSSTSERWIIINNPAARPRRRARASARR